MIGVEKGGIQAVEGLILARYMMFVQVYFHHTRRAYDHHVTRTLSYLLIRNTVTCTGSVVLSRPPRTERTWKLT